MDLNEPRYAGTSLMLAGGFRPFFLLTGLYAVLGVLSWAGLFAHGADFPATQVPALWHGHEMVFGFAGAAIAGFLLTAVPNWTGGTPVHGPPLGLLVVLWLLGRVALWLVDFLPAWLVAIVDLSFLPLLGGLVAQMIIAARNQRNYVFIGLFTVFFAGNLLYHADILWPVLELGSSGLYLGLYAVVGMVTVVTGRIVPNFTGNALRQQGIAVDISTPPNVEKGTLLSVLAALLASLVVDAGPVTGLLALVASGFLALRMARWGTRHTFGSPIVWVLHAGHAWLVLGFAVKGLGDLTGWLSSTTAIHALTAGAIGTMVLAVTTRASLGHSGRPLVVSGAIPWAYVLVSLGALLRVFGPDLLPFDYGMVVAASGVLWAAAFAIFTVVYLPILTRPRLDGRPG